MTLTYRHSGLFRFSALDAVDAVYSSRGQPVLVGGYFAERCVGVCPVLAVCICTNGTGMHMHMHVHMQDARPPYMHTANSKRLLCGA